MKKTITIASILLAPFAVSAQDFYQLPDGKSISRQFFQIPATIMTFFLIGIFILTIIRWTMDHRLKSKLVDKGVPDEVVKQFLHSDHKDSKTNAIKWFLILAGIGIGLAITSFTLPIGIHSVAIMAFSISLSFLGYYYYIKRSDNRQMLP